MINYTTEELKQIPEYHENAITQKLSKICADAGCQNSRVRIRFDNLVFDDPKHPNDWLTYAYIDGKWVKCTRTMNPWCHKIECGLNLHYPNGIPDMLPYMTLEDHLQFNRQWRKANGISDN